MTGGLTAHDVRETSFGKPPWGKRGYSEVEVDALLEVVEATITAMDRRA